VFPAVDPILEVPAIKVLPDTLTISVSHYPVETVDDFCDEDVDGGPLLAGLFYYTRKMHGIARNYKEDTKRKREGPKDTE
jgi:hypothetical protein